MTTFACIGHWYVSLVYAAPALLLGGGIGIATLRDRRRRAAAATNTRTQSVRRDPAATA
jgi:hypothetical protein